VDTEHARAALAAIGEPAATSAAASPWSSGWGPATPWPWVSCSWSAAGSVTGTASAASACWSSASWASCARRGRGRGWSGHPGGPGGHAAGEGPAAIRDNQDHPAPRPRLRPPV